MRRFVRLLQSVVLVLGFCGAGRAAGSGGAHGTEYASIIAVDGKNMNRLYPGKPDSP